MKIRSSRNKKKKKLAELPRQLINRPPLPLTESKDTWFASQLLCPVVLSRTLCGKEGGTRQCGTYSIPKVTDLEYDHLIGTQLSSVDQVIIVHVTSAKEMDKTIKEMATVYRNLSRSKSMPCIQSCSDPFQLLKYNITSASKFTGNSCPFLVQRHNVIPGIFWASVPESQNSSSLLPSLQKTRTKYTPLALTKSTAAKL
ncbi:uncharacterized protein C3orf20 homolog [Hyaena hyaena]|uniref:uncharacterized protein C3orf20 homolog n=1 Tax=Hyaena hyaena TaxID=95912 RepID=UPI001923177A|nr:uncharacterized protein C3orf20 homolog [Hyaena hyaena]